MYLALRKHVDIEDFMDISPWLYIVLGEFYVYAAKYGLPVIITSILDDDPNRKSETHEQGRAIDISDNGWTKLHIHRVVYHLNQKYGKLCGTAPEKRPPVVAVYHNAGSGYHFHLQVRRFAYIDYEFEDEQR